MAIVVTGADGQLGRECYRQLGGAATPLHRADLDLEQVDRVYRLIVERRPNLVIHCAAYTAVDRAEDEPQRCQAVNVAAVAEIARACRDLGAGLLYVSTDYVFGGDAARRLPYTEDDRPAPLGVYARSKLAGEQAAAVCPRHWIVRTCGLYARQGHAGARNFVQAILARARGGQRLRVVADQRCSPSYVPHVARGILAICGAAGLAAAPVGVYHVVNGGETSWHGFAEELLRRADLCAEVQAIASAEYPARAPRPLYSVLDTAKYHRLNGPAMPPWADGLAAFFGDPS